MKPIQYDWERVNSDINGNPRYVLHFLNIASDYETAVRLANKIGGRKYHTKGYGGGIVFQSYSLHATETAIAEIIEKETAYMKTQTQINWTPKLNKESDWDGIELNDPETGITHASLDHCTPEALALIAAAPELLESLRWASERVAGRGSFEDYMKCQRAIAKAEGGAA